jgi:hypothetical protein
MSCRRKIEAPVHGLRMPSRNSAMYAIECDASDQEAKRFYLKYGFVALQDDELHLYLPIATIEAAGRSG